MLDKLSTLPNPDGVFEGIGEEEIEFITHTMFAEIFFPDKTLRDTNHQSRLACLAGRSFDLNERQVHRLITISEMLEDKDEISYLGHLATFKTFFKNYTINHEVTKKNDELNSVLEGGFDGSD